MGIHQISVPVVTIDGKEYVALAEHSRVVAEINCAHVYDVADLRRDTERLTTAFEADRVRFFADVAMLRRSAEFDKALMGHIEAQTKALERVAQALTK